MRPLIRRLKELLRGSISIRAMFAAPVQSGAAEGAEVEQSHCPLPARGYWFPPTFLTGVTMANRVAQEEIFGPVLSIMTFRTPEEAFERANNIPYGLSA